MIVKEVMEMYVNKYDYAIRDTDMDCEFWPDINGLLYDWSMGDSATYEEYADHEAKEIDLEAYHEEKTILIVV